MEAAAAHKLSSAKFTEFVKDIKDLYALALRNGYYLPAQKSSAVNEKMLLNVLQDCYWCPKFQDIRLKPCPKLPSTTVLSEKLLDVCARDQKNI